MKNCSICKRVETTGFERNLCPFFKSNMKLFDENNCVHFLSRKIKEGYIYVSSLPDEDIKFTRTNDPMKK